MSAQTLSPAFSKHLNSSISLNPEYDDFNNISAVNSGHDYDEEERLRQEYQAYRKDSGSRQIIRPAPKLDRNNEIIQDGLGSDDLIPSEWATGSSAQFAKLAPRSRSRADELESHYSPSLNYSPPSPLYQRQATLGPQSPLSHSDSSQMSYMHEGPPSPIPGDSYGSVSKAREKARRLAKEREKSAVEQPTMMGFPQDGHDYSNRQWQFEGNKQEGAESGDRMRTISTPSAYKPETGSSKKAKYPPSSSRNQEPGMLRSSSKTSLLDESSPQSKIPLPTSGSMSKYQNQQSPTNKVVHRSKSSSRLATVATPPHQDGVEDSSTTDMIGSMNGKRQTRKTPQQKLDYSPPTQDVLDEFGPLGGVPKRVRGPGWGSTEDEGARAVSDTRTVSHPWDEEMLPTVKRRLEQQRMLDELSRDDGFVDTWDRNGMPLSRSPIQLKVKSKGGDERVQSVLGQDQQSPSQLKIDRQDRVVDEESIQRMKRLQEQLDLGMSADQSYQQSSHNHDHKSPSIVQEQAKAERDNLKTKSSTNYPPPTSEPTPALPLASGTASTPQIDQKERPAGTSKGHKESDVVDDAGCCKCTIM